MPITPPDLDDRTYASLMEEALALIPTLAPAWTDLNASDPGITLVELLAYLTEILIYRLDRVTDANRQAFLRLLNGPAVTPDPGRTTDEAIRDAVRTLRTPVRAVTARDYVRHALAADPRVARAFCLPSRDLTGASPFGAAPAQKGRISVVIVPRADAAVADGQPPPDLLRKVADDLEPRRLLTTRVAVVGPARVRVGVRATLVLRADAPRAFSDLSGEGTADRVRGLAVGALRLYFDPLSGGPDGTGWPFGRDVFVSEVYQVLGAVPGVDHVTPTAGPRGGPLDELTVPDADAARLRRSPTPAAPGQGLVYAISLQAHELVDALIDPQAITVHASSLRRHP